MKKKKKKKEHNLSQWKCTDPWDSYHQFTNRFLHYIHTPVVNKLIIKEHGILKDI